MSPEISTHLEKNSLLLAINDLQLQDLEEELVVLYKECQSLVDISLEIGGRSRKLALRLSEALSQEWF